MFIISRRSWFLGISFFLFPIVAHAQVGTITGKVIAPDGKPLAYASLMLVGTTWGSGAMADGNYKIVVPAGRYELKVRMMGYAVVTKANVEVKTGETVHLDFTLVPEPYRMHEIIVHPEPVLVKPDESHVEFETTHKQLKEMPLDNAVAAAARTPGLVQMGDLIFAQGGRPDETRILINGIPIANPLNRQTVDLSSISTAGSQAIVGGMDPEYGDAQSAIINLTTREGSDHFKGEVRYITDDFGRSDKSYTNMDRLALSLGGPTWWQPLRYFVSGEGVWADGENNTIEPRPEHKLTDFLKFRERQSAAYNMQGKLTYNPQSNVKINGEAIYSTSRSDQYLNNWNVSGYVGKVWYFQQLVYAVAPEPGQTEIMEFGGVRSFNHGPWAEIKDAA
ncbi:MAG TPA: TonB-dependent receptor, partial [Candidatus Krumholzibacteria bacterium]|nr:TonB-dependent receptor [Candidatus Krumholzibacteria bacterium]